MPYLLGKFNDFIFFFSTANFSKSGVEMDVNIFFEFCLANPSPFDGDANCTDCRRGVDVVIANKLRSLIPRILNPRENILCKSG